MAATFPADVPNNESLSSTIFGDAASSGGDGGELTGVFASSKSLPEKPHHEFPPKPINKKTERVEKAVAQESEVKVGATGRKEKKGKERREKSRRKELKDKSEERTPEKSTRPDDSPAESNHGNESNTNSEQTLLHDEGVEEKAVAESETVETSASKISKDEVNARTVFVGNLPPSTTRKSLASLFRPCGKVVSARLRSLAFSGVKLPPQHAGNQSLMKKVCANTDRFDEECLKKTVQGYVVFAEESAVSKALEMNRIIIPGTKGKDALRLRVDTSTPTVDPSRSVFVGNLPYSTDECTLADTFVRGCDLDPEEVVSARVIRDPETMQCKGFGYVLFKDRSSVPAALRMDGTEYMKRSIRVRVCGKRTKGRRGGAVETKTGESAGKKGRKRKQVDGKAIIGMETHKKKRRTAAERNAARRSAAGSGSKARAAGVSRRAAREAKVGKRIKKIQKRIGRGMGKAKSK